MSTAPRFIEPNLYHLHSKGKTLKIEYSTSSIAGVPLFSAVLDGATYSYRGDEIATLDSPIGRLVTVTLTVVPDLESVTLTLVVPAMNLDGNDGAISTFAVITTHRTSIGGPALVKGQIQTYRRIALTGTAEQVVF
jgi:hypothetical protein